MSDPHNDIHRLEARLAGICRTLERLQHEGRGANQEEVSGLLESAREAHAFAKAPRKAMDSALEAVKALDAIDAAFFRGE